MNRVLSPSSSSEAGPTLTEVARSVGGHDGSTRSSRSVDDPSGITRRSPVWTRPSISSIPGARLADQVASNAGPYGSWSGKEVSSVVDKKKGKDKRKDPILKKKEDREKEKSK